MKKNLLLSLVTLMTLSLVLFSCKDDNDNNKDPYDVTVEILNPTSGEILTAGGVSIIRVQYTHADANEVIHNIKIVINDAEGNLVATVMDHHAHQTGSFTFQDDGFIVPTTPGNYTLVAETTNMEGAHTKSASQNFSIE